MTLNKKPFFILCSLLFVLLNFALNLPLAEITSASSTKSTLKHSQDHLSNGFVTSHSKAENTTSKRYTFIEEGIAPYNFLFVVFHTVEKIQIFSAQKNFISFLTSSSSARAPPLLS